MFFQIHNDSIGPQKSKEMKIIDKDTKKRLNQTDPVIKDAQKAMTEDELSPMDPPEAYDKQWNSGELEYENCSEVIKQFMDEHKAALEVITRFDNALVEFKESMYNLTEETNNVFSEFFNFFDSNLVPHNFKEERVLFGLLHKRLIESGEHSTDEVPRTSINLMEDDHNKFIQLATLTFNFLGLAARLKDKESAILVLDIAFNNGKELVELLRLHIYQEENKLFPLAEQLIGKEEFAAMNEELKAL